MTRSQLEPVLDLDPQPRPLPNLEGERTICRLPSEYDIPQILAFYERNREHLEKVQSPRPREFYTKTYWRMRCLSVHQEFEDDRSCQLVVFDRNEPKVVIGYCNYASFIRGHFFACRLGYGIDKDYEGKGYMYEALNNSIRFLFDELNMHRIEANYLPYNERSGALLERLGFKKEGYAEHYLNVHGRWEPHVLTSLTNPSWKRS